MALVTIIGSYLVTTCLIVQVAPVATWGTHTVNLELISIRTASQDLTTSPFWVSVVQVGTSGRMSLAGDTSLIFTGKHNLVIVESAWDRYGMVAAKSDDVNGNEAHG